MSKARGSLWKNSTKKKGFSQSRGAYKYDNGDRYFKLTPEKDGKSKVYESPQAAKEAGWYISVKGK